MYVSKDPAKWWYRARRAYRGTNFWPDSQTEQLWWGATPTPQSQCCKMCARASALTCISQWDGWSNIEIRGGSEGGEKEREREREQRTWGNRTSGLLQQWQHCPSLHVKCVGDYTQHNMLKLSGFVLAWMTVGSKNRPSVGRPSDLDIIIARTSVSPIFLSSESACPTQECAVTTSYGHRRQHRSRMFATLLPWCNSQGSYRTIIEQL